MNSIDIFPWNENFNTGVAKIDEQHQKLVQLLNLLASHVAFQADIPALDVIFDQLAGYAVYHFQTEEAIWHEYLPDDVLESKHKVVHQQFLETVLDLRRAECSKPIDEVIGEVLAFLARWLASHILESDRYMAAVVLAIKSGMCLESAKQHANEQLSGSTKVLIDIILSIYESLSVNTLRLMRELAEHKRDQESLRKFKLAVEQSSSSIVITDLAANIEFVNAAFIGATGYSRAEAIGKNPKILQSGKTPQTTYLDMWGALTQGKAWKGELINKRKDGSEYVEMALISPVHQPDGSITHFLAVKEDITERKRLESELVEQLSFIQAVIDVEVDGLAVCHAIHEEPYTHFTVWNRSMEAITGFSLQEINALGWYQTVYIDPEVQVRAKLRMERMRQGEHLCGEEWEITRKDGLKRTVHIHTKIVGNDSSGPHVLAVMHDITERKHSEQALREAKVAAEQASIAKSEFLANMSHEIRTPMNAIIGLSQLMLITSLNSKQHDYLDKILGSSEHLLGILNDILDFSKIEANRLTIAIAEFDLVELIHNQEALFYACAEKPLKFDLQISSDVPRYLMGDALRLQQILANLLSNSIKFTDQGFVRLMISVASSDQAHINLKFSIEDSGIGISLEQQKLLFQPFAQADGSISRRFGGTGLGLAITRKLLFLMGSEIYMQSTYGKGTSFWFEIQFGLARQDKLLEFGLPPVKIMTAAKLQKLAVGLANTRVLLVEDNPLNQQVTSEFLRNAGLKIVTANDGRQALDLLENNNFDIVLMDIQMPGMDGLQATRQIRNQARFANLPVIAMSAGVTSIEQEQCQLAGMTDFIPKPIDPMQMLKQLAKALAVSRPLFSNNSMAENSMSSQDIPIEFDLPGFDCERLLLLELLLEERAIVIQSIVQFAENFSNIEQDLSDLLDKHEWQLAGEKLHALKGVASNLGANQVAESANAMEKALKQGGECAAEFCQFCNDWKVIIRTVESILTKTTPEIDLDDSGRLSSDLQLLHELLKTNKLVPIDLLTRITAGFPEKQAETISRLRKAINSFNYDKALQILKTMQ